MRLREANAMLIEQVTEAERDCDATAVDSSTMVVRASHYRDLHATLLGECGGVIDVLSPAWASVEECLGNVPRLFAEVILHVV